MISFKLFTSLNCTQLSRCTLLIACNHKSITKKNHVYDLFVPYLISRWFSGRRTQRFIRLNVWAWKLSVRKKRRKKLDSSCLQIRQSLRRRCPGSGRKCKKKPWWSKKVPLLTNPLPQKPLKTPQPRQNSWTRTQSSPRRSLLRRWRATAPQRRRNQKSPKIRKIHPLPLLPPHLPPPPPPPPLIMKMKSPRSSSALFLLYRSIVSNYFSLSLPNL